MGRCEKIGPAPERMRELAVIPSRDHANNPSVRAVFAIEIDRENRSPCSANFHKRRKMG
jgi:hypothetical protein